MSYNNRSYSKWSKELEVSSRTTKSSLTWLIENKWVTVNSKKETLKIISYKKLSKKLGLKFKTGYLFEPTNYKYFKAMCCGVVLTFYMGKKRYFNRRSGDIKGSANFCKRLKNCKKNNGFTPMPNDYLAKSLNVSTATAYRYKEEAEKGGFIETKANLVYLTDDLGKRISSDNYYAFIVAHKQGGIPNTIRNHKAHLRRVEADLIHSYIVLKKKNVGF